MDYSSLSGKIIFCNITLPYKDGNTLGGIFLLGIEPGISSCPVETPNMFHYAKEVSCL
jgi:hypothetical protein